jgi:enoyl-CoA hydratase
MPVETEARGRVLVVTIRREEKRNAIDQEIADGISAALDHLDDDPELWVGVLTGTATVFSAGSDLARSRGGSAATDRGGEYGVIRRDRSKPLIAAVEGPALGGGFEIVLACDLVVASTTATFGIPEVKRSLVAGAGGLFRLPRKIPFNVAMELALTGDPIGAELAHHHGLVNRLCEPGEALEVAIGLAEQICANAPVAVRETRKIVLEATNAPDEIGWKMSFEGMAKAMSSEDFSEGLTAFIEKRPPKWTGR